jgi:glycosyltransferase involved in cell wall biosynthesis
MARELTIVVPTKNGADRIGGMIRSLLAEIDAAGVLAEIIVVDDLSTDDTPKVLGSMAADDHRIVPMAGPGRGPGAARNAAVRAARSRWIAFADDDDPWTPGRLATQMEALRANPDAVLSLTDYAHVREDQPDAVLPSAFEYWPLWRSFRARTVSRIEDARPLIAAENAVGTSTVMVSRDAYVAVGGFDETLPSASDWDLWLRLAAAGPTLILGVEGVRYAMRAGSVSSNRARATKRCGRSSRGTRICRRGPGAGLSRVSPPAEAKPPPIRAGPRSPSAMPCMPASFSPAVASCVGCSAS